MLLEENKALARHAMDLINQRDFVGMDQIYTPDYVRHDPDNPRVNTRETYKQYITGLSTVFPNLTFTVEDLVAEDDKAVCRFSIRGTHLEPWRGLPATGKEVMITGLAVSHIVDGKIVEDWFNTDIFGLAQQLGLVPNFRL